MAKRKDFVSDGLMTLRHKYVAENLNSRKGDEDTSASYDIPELDKTLSLEEQQMQMYSQVRNDLDMRLNQLLAELECQIDNDKNTLAANEKAYELSKNINSRFAELPKTIEPEKNPDAITDLEQLRADFFRVNAGIKKNDTDGSENQTKANPQQLSLLPELNSLNQLQMLKMGLCFAMPLIIGIIVGCVIISWAVIMTFGG